MTPPYDDPPLVAAPPSARPVTWPGQDSAVPAPMAEGADWTPAMTRGQAGVDILAIIVLNFVLQVALFAAKIPSLL